MNVPGGGPWWPQARVFVARIPCCGWNPESEGGGGGFRGAGEVVGVVVSAGRFCVS